MADQNLPSRSKILRATKSDVGAALENLAEVGGGGIVVRVTMYVESLEAIEATWEDLFRDCHHSCIITVKVVFLNGEEEIDLVNLELMDGG